MDWPGFCSFDHNFSLPNSPGSTLGSCWWEGLEIGGRLSLCSDQSWADWKEPVTIYIGLQRFLPALDPLNSYNKPRVNGSNTTGSGGNKYVNDAKFHCHPG